MSDPSILPDPGLANGQSSQADKKPRTKFADLFRKSAKKGDGFERLPPDDFGASAANEAAIATVALPQFEKVSLARLTALTICFAGVQFGWAIQIAYSTPFFMTLGVPIDMVSLIWLAGPVSGLLVQPIVGSISDKSQLRFGRRRPFIMIGTFFIVLGMLVISNATLLGSFFPEHETTVSISLGIVGFWILDLSNNMVQGPCRALLVDSVPAEQQATGSAFFSFMLGIGNIAGYLSGSVHWVEFFPWFGTDFRFLFSVGIAVLLLCVIISVCSTKERPYIPVTTEKGPGMFTRIFHAIKEIPKATARVCMVQFFTWMGWFCFFMFFTDWMGEQVYGGDPLAQAGSPSLLAYEEGVRAACIGSTLNAAISCLLSFLIPPLMNQINPKIIYFVGMALLGTVLTSCMFIGQNKVWAIINVALMGVPWAVTMILPFTIVGADVGPERSGIYMGVLNLSVVVPQLLVASTIGIILKHFGASSSVALLAGGVSAFVAAALVFFIVIPPGAITRRVDI